MELLLKYGEETGAFSLEDKDDGGRTSRGLSRKLLSSVAELRMCDRTCEYIHTAAEVHIEGRHNGMIAVIVFLSARSLVAVFVVWGPRSCGGLPQAPRSSRPRRRAASPA